MYLESQHLDAVEELVPLSHYVCLPGDPVLAVLRGAVVATEGELTLIQGPANSPYKGLLVSEISATLERVPHLLHKQMPCYSVASPAARRYVPCEADPVVATILRSVGSQCYQCYIAGHSMAYLDTLAFDGATKKNRPRLKEGDIVYAYIKRRPNRNVLDHTTRNNRTSMEESCSALIETSAEVHLSCVAAEIGLAPNDWTSEEIIFGPLYGGQVLTLPLPYVRRLMFTPPSDAIPASYLISAIGSRVPFEVCIGANGRVWVKGKGSEVDPTAGARRTVAVCACLTEAQYDNTREEMEARVNAFFPESSVSC